MKHWIKTCCQKRPETIMVFYVKPVCHNVINICWKQGPCSKSSNKKRTSRTLEKYCAQSGGLIVVPAQPEVTFRPGEMRLVKPLSWNKIVLEWILFKMALWNLARVFSKLLSDEKGQNLFEKCKESSEFWWDVTRTQPADHVNSYKNCLLKININSDVLFPAKFNSRKS